MTTRLLAGLLLALSTFIYSADPALAQRRPSPRDIEDVRSRLRAAEERQERQADAWAAARNLPLRLYQADGRLVELLGVDDGRPLYMTSYNSIAAATTHTEALHPGHSLGLSLTGRGMLIGLWDAGHPLLTHQEFTDRIALGDVADAHNHATHVAGTLAASGVNREARGMAFEARLRAFDWSKDETEMMEEGLDGLLLSNHSYGPISGWYYGDLEDNVNRWYWLGDPKVSTVEDYTFGHYGDGAAQYDLITESNPFYLPVVAAGNDRNDDGPQSGVYRALNDRYEWQTFDVASRPIPGDGDAGGFDTISGAGTGKNVLTVGSIGRLNDTTIRISPFSGYGPTDDGRIKPDLVGYGERVFSTVSSGPDRYGISSGTSMASPNVTGSLTLLQQHYQNYYGTPMLAATLKGLALHTAEDLDEPGPDYRTGWGVLNAEAAARLITASLDNGLALLEDELVLGAVYELVAAVETPGPVRLTLSWTDPASSPTAVTGPSTLDNTRRHLRNDLDVRLIDEASGTVYEPYVLDPAHPDAPATPGDNVRDPIEQVYLPYAEAGSYRVVVTHKGFLQHSKPQAFSLIATGLHAEARPVVARNLKAAASVDGVDLDWETLIERSSGTFRVERVAFKPGSGKNVPESAAYVTIGRVTTAGLGTDVRAYSFGERLVPSGFYRYRLVFEGPDRSYVAAEVDVNVPVPEAFIVLSNYPNPFSDRTTVVVDVPRAQDVEVEIFDALGRRLQVLVDTRLAAGRHELSVDAASWPAGVYFARVRAAEGIRTHQMVVVR